MSSTLSYGYKQPTNGDKGTSYFPDLNYNITRVNAHSHNGNDSAILKSGNVQATTQTITSGSWVSVGGGRYRQVVTMPTSPTTMMFDNYYPQFKITSTGEPIQGVGVEKIGANLFYVYVNDNTLNLTVLYLS
jgi:hypothetical protein